MIQLKKMQPKPDERIGWKLSITTALATLQPRPQISLFDSVV